MIKDIILKVKRLINYTKGSRRQLFFAVLFSSLNRLIAVWMIADLMGNSVRAIEAEEFALLIRAIFLTLPWLLSLIAFNAISVYLFGITTARASASLRSNLLDKLLGSSLAASGMTHSGAKLSWFTNDNNAAFDTFLAAMTIPISSVLTGIVCLIYVIHVHWFIAIIALVIGLLTYLYSILFAKLLHRIAEKMQGLMAVMESRMKDILDSMTVSRIFEMKKKLESGMDEASGDLCREGIRWARISGVLGSFNNAASDFSERVLIFIAAIFMLSGILSLSELMRVSQMAGGIIGIFHVSRTLIAIQRSMAGAGRIFNVMDSTKPEPSGKIRQIDENLINKPHTDKNILGFSSVSFGYISGQHILHEISFEVKMGEMIAITGKSGSGKSTILRLCQGLYFPVQGRVVFMGIPAEDWEIAALRNKMSLVPQEPVLFPGTIAENISLGNKNPDKNRIIKAAKDSYAHDFITAMPLGYETKVKERGTSLSGGERQRIAIARALYHDADLLLLDEATSAMDAESEAAVHNTLAGLKGKKTILYVTHREAAIKLADKIINIK